MNNVKEAAYALGNDLANAPRYLAKGRQFSNDDLPILIRHLNAFADSKLEEATHKAIRFCDCVSAGVRHENEDDCEIVKAIQSLKSSGPGER